MLTTCLVATCLAATLSAGGDRAVRPDPSRDVTAITAEVHAFYRDFSDGRWSAMLDHFLPAKVTARWAPPEHADTWARLTAPPVEMSSTSSDAKCEPTMAIAIVGDWARVFARRCAAVDEAWLLRVSGRWKIVHLDLNVEIPSLGSGGGRAVNGRIPIRE